MLEWAQSAQDRNVMAGTPRPGSVVCYVVRRDHKIVDGGIASNMEEARAVGKERWPRSEVVEVGAKMTVTNAERWARKNGYLK
jgi:hypothetical protein